MRVPRMPKMSGHSTPDGDVLCGLGSVLWRGYIWVARTTPPMTARMPTTRRKIFQKL